jgi:hypothetical protein
VNKFIALDFCIVRQEKVKTEILNGGVKDEK